MSSSGASRWAWARFRPLIIFIMRHDLPETAVWLIRQGRFREAKQVASRCTTIRSTCCRTRTLRCRSRAPTAFLADTRKDPIRWRATLYGWIACFAQGSEFSTFAFYIPVLFVMVGVSSILGTNLVTMALYVVAAISGWVGPLLTPRIGHRGISIAGFRIVFVSLLVAAAALYTGNKEVLPFAAAAMLWGHYWDASNCMTIPSHGRQARISRHGERLRLHVRQAAVVSRDLPVSRRCSPPSARPTPRCSSPFSR